MGGRAAVNGNRVCGKALALQTVRKKFVNLTCRSDGFYAITGTFILMGDFDE